MRFVTRLLKPEEDIAYEKVQAVAFEKEYDESVKEEAKTSVISRKIGVFHEDGKTWMGCLQINDYRCRYDGNEVSLGGIGGVATLPQYRHNGVIRSAMQFALQDMYEKGQTFSYLYPFSTQYYRKFGFEPGSVLQEWTIPLKDLPQQKMNGTVEQIFPGDSTKELLDIYEKFYQEYNLSSIRNVYSEELERENLLKQKRYVFLYRNEQGKATGFFIMNKEQSEKGIMMQCVPSFRNYNDFLFLDSDAISGMFSFIKQAFGAYYDFLKIALPDNVCISSLVGENNTAECRLFHEGMVRVVNVENALSLCKCKGSGSVCIEIQDNMISKNHGRWKVCFEERTQTKVERTDDEPDISLPINDFSTLICGARSMDDIRYMPNVVIYRNHMELEKIFYRKKCHMTELF